MSHLRGSYCPACGKKTLYCPDWDRVACNNPECPQPDALYKILSNPETEHIVIVGDDEWSAQHPLRERIDGELFDCQLVMAISEAFRLHGIQQPPGRYRVVRTNEQEEPWLWERL